MPIDMAEPVMLDELEQTWVDEMFDSIVAASFSEYASPPGPPTRDENPWRLPAQPFPASDDRRLDGTRLRTPIAGYQRSPPRSA